MGTSTSKGAIRPILWPVLVPSLLFATGLGAIVPVLVIAALQIGATTSFAAGIVGLMGVVSLVATVPAGILIDRLGDARAMLVATVAAVFVYGLTIASLAWESSASLVLYAVSLMLLAPIRDVWNLARQAVVAEALPAALVGKAMTALGGSMRAGTLIGPIVGAGLLLALPTWSVFAFAAIAAVAAVSIMFLPAARTLDVQAAAARERNEKAAASADDPSSPPARQRLDVRWRAVTLAGVSIATLAMARVVQPIVVQLWGVEIGLHESTVSLLIALGAALELIVMIPAAYVKDRMGRVVSLLTCLAVFGGGYVLMVVLPNLTGMVIAVLVMALGNGMGAGINMTIGADLSPAVGRARFLGIWAIFTNVGRVGGPSLVSLLIVVSSLEAGVLAIGAMTAAGAAWILGWSRAIGLPGRFREDVDRAAPPTNE